LGFYSLLGGGFGPFNLLGPGKRVLPAGRLVLNRVLKRWGVPTEEEVVFM